MIQRTNSVRNATFPMNIHVEKKANCEADLRIEVPADTVKSKRSTITNKYKTYAKLPGFRPGKAPAAVVEKKFGKEIGDELHDEMVREALSKAVKDHDLKVLGVKSVSDETFQDDGNFTFTAVVSLEPEVELPEYKGIQVRVPKVEVTDEHIDKELESLRERFADFVEVEERGVAMGDIAVLSYSATIDGQPMKEVEPKVTDFIAGREKHWVKIDEESFLPGFCGQLIDLKKGEKNDKVEVTMPGDFPLESLRGVEVIYSVEINEIKEQKLPELDDEFANKLMEGKTLADIKSIITENIESQMQQQRENAIVDQVIAHLGKSVEVELPADVVARETQRRVDEMVYRGQSQGMDAEAIESQQREIFAAAEAQARAGVKSSFILEKIAAAEKIEATDDELFTQIAQQAQKSGTPIKKYVKQVQKEGRVESIKHQIQIGKVIDFLKENVVIEEVEADEAADA